MGLLQRWKWRRPATASVKGLLRETCGSPQPSDVRPPWLYGDPNLKTGIAGLRTLLKTGQGEPRSLSTKARIDVGGRGKVVGACFVELESLKDLGRLACAFERAPFPIFMSKKEGKYRLAVQTDLFM